MRRRCRARRRNGCAAPGVVTHVFTHFPLELTVYTAEVGADDAGASRHALGGARRSARRSAAQCHAQGARACGRAFRLKHADQPNGASPDAKPVSTSLRALYDDAANDPQRSQPVTGGRVMAFTRRNMLAATGAAAAMTFTRTALGGWEPSERYPDPAIQILDPALREISHRAGQRRAARHRHALVRGAGLFRRRALPALERHPQQPHHALGRGDRRASASTASRRTTPTATRATARAGSSPASTTRGA